SGWLPTAGSEGLRRPTAESKKLLERLPDQIGHRRLGSVAAARQTAGIVSHSSDSSENRRRSIITVSSEFQKELVLVLERGVYWWNDVNFCNFFCCHWVPRGPARRARRGPDTELK